MGGLSMKKYSALPPVFKNDQMLTGENFTRLLPNTLIGEGITGLKFIGCNLVNCILPIDALKTDCLHVQKSFCYHLHPKMGLPVEEADCAHVVDEITNGNVTVYIRKGTVL